MNDSENPYAAPIEACAVGSTERMLVAGARSTLLASGLLYRRVAVEAPIEAVIEFNGRSVWRDVVKIDDRVAVWKTSWYRIAPELQLELRADGAVLPVVISVRLGRFLRMRAFTIRIGDRVVYREAAASLARGTADAICRRS